MRATEQVRARRLGAEPSRTMAVDMRVLAGVSRVGRSFATGVAILVIFGRFVTAVARTLTAGVEILAVFGRAGLDVVVVEV